MQNIQRDAPFLVSVIYSDGCIFQVDEKDNKHNVRILGTENPHETRKGARDGEKETVWCAMSVNQVYGSYYFDSFIATSESNKQLVTFYFLLIVVLVPNLPTDTIFWQGSAPTDYRLEVRQHLGEKLHENWIRRKGPIHWAASSPD